MNKLILIALGFTTLTTIGCGNAFQGDKPSAESLSVPAPQSKFLVGAIGDSISRGYNISALGQEDLANNWITGLSLSASVVNHFSASFGSITNVSSINVAVAGETVLSANSTFQAQATQLAAENPSVVTIEIGSNDVCQGNMQPGSAAAEFKTKMVTALNTLKSAQHKPSSIVVLSIPNIFALTQISSLSSNPICQTAWALLCPNLQAGQATFQAQWQAANDALKAAAVEVGGSVVFDNGAVSSTVFAAADVSAIDCFHPSISGQTKLATAVWAGFSSNF